MMAKGKRINVQRMIYKATPKKLKMCNNVIERKIKNKKKTLPIVILYYYYFLIPV